MGKHLPKPNRKHSKPNQKIHQAQTANNMLGLNQALDNGDIHAALQFAQKILQSPGSTLQELDEAFQTFSSTGDTVSALQVLRISLSKDKASIDAAYRFLARFSISGDAKDLEMSLQLLPRSQEHNGTIIYMLGRLHEFYLQHENFQKGDEILTQLTQIDPNCLILHIQKACQQLVQQTLTLASVDFLAKIFEISLEELPDQPFLLGLSRVLNFLELYDESEKVIELGLEVSPDDPVLVHELAWICNLREEWEEAIYLLEKCVYLYKEQGADGMVKDSEMKIQWIRGQMGVVEQQQ